MALAKNFATDFTYPVTLTSSGSAVTCSINLMSYSERNYNWVYIGPAENYNLSTREYALKGVKSGTHSFTVPIKYFKKNNAALGIECGTWEDNVTFVSGSFEHTVLLYHPNYKHYLHTFTFPSRTYPGEICTIDILPARDKHPKETYVEIELMYHQSVGRDVIATNLSTGKFSFVVPALSVNSSISIYAKTKVKGTNEELGTICQSIKIEAADSTSTSTSVINVQPPSITLPENYELTLSEGENVKITGTSENLSDYMIIYAKKPCDVSKAVSDYTSAQGYYAAPPIDLKNKLIENATGNACYYILKDFDEDSTFMTQDPDDKKSFWIRTPETNDYEIVKDFYALQWMKGLEPGDLAYIYAIQRGIKYTTTTTHVTSSAYTSAMVETADSWTCKHCDLYNYAYWNIRNNWNPYCRVSLATTKTFLAQNSTNGSTISAMFTIEMGQSIKHAPVIYVTTSSNKNATGSTYLTLYANTTGTKFSYTIPMSFIKNAINCGYSNIYFHTHWGNNTENAVQYSKNGLLTLNAFREGSTTSSSNTTQDIAYSNNCYKNITNIPLSTMTPYIVVPPAVRPIELAIKDMSKSKATITYPNPLYNTKTESIATYDALGQIEFDVSNGDDINDLSDLNPIYDADDNEIQIDPTLDININEKRFATYEKSIKLSTGLINAIKKVSTNDVYIDLHLKSIDGGRLNFKTLLSSGAKIQLMLSKNGSDKTRLVDFSGNVIDYKRPEYTIFKVRVNKNIIIDNEYDTIHLLYNTDKYDNGKSFNIENCTMEMPEGKVSNKVGIRKIDPASNTYGVCSFTSDTFNIARYALNFPLYKIRLCLENMIADKKLFDTPVVKIQHRNVAAEGETPITETVLCPIKQGPVDIGEDIYYDIPQDLYNVNIDDILLFSLSLPSPYPIDTPEITFSNVFIEVIGLHEINELVDKYTTGFTANAIFFEEKKEVSNTVANLSTYDPVECVDIIMCCFDSDKQLINKTNSKRRDIYNGKEFVYYTDRKWHNFVNNKYMNHSKYKEHYDMVFNIPSETEYYFFIAFTYSNWHDNPSIYSMSNILAVNSVKQDFSIDFIEPIISIDSIDGSKFANVDINNPEIILKVNSQRSSNIAVTDNLSNNGFNLARDKFNRDKWIANPILYSNTKQFGYELPIFNSADVYNANNVVGSLEPLYNDIEYYYQWSSLYGKELVHSSAHLDNSIPIEIDSKYTVYEDEADKFISNRAVPYIEIPKEISSYDRSKITLFLDTNFGMDLKEQDIGQPIKPTKLITDTFTINYEITKFRSPYWGVAHLWNKGLMERLGDLAAIEDIKIEWGMKLNLDHRHPTAGRRGPILVEDFWAAASHYYGYNPLTIFAFLKDKNIRDYGGNDIWHKNYGDYIYFEITNPRLKRLFLESNCHARRHDAILFEDYVYDWCWEKTVKVRFTVTKRVYEDGTPIYSQNLPEENFTANHNVAGWSLYEKPKFKMANIVLTKAPTASDPSFVLKYDVMLSPLVFKHNNANGDMFGNKFKYSWGTSVDHYMKWETVTVRGNAPYTHEQTHYFITYNKDYNVSATFRFRVNNDGTVTQL